MVWGMISFEILFQKYLPNFNSNIKVPVDFGYIEISFEKNDKIFTFLFQLTSSCSFNGSSEKLVKCTFHRTPNPEALFFVYKKCHLHLNNCRQIKQNFIFEKLSNVSWCVTCVTQSNFKLHQKNTLFSFISSAAQYITWSKSFLPRYWWLKIVLLNE